MPLYYSHKPSGQRSQFWGDYADLKCKPLFPFGFGLSYSSFSYSDGALDAIEVAPNGRIRASITSPTMGRVMATRSCSSTCATKRAASRGRSKN